MTRVTHFEIHADDPQRAADFYSALFGWKITKWDGPIEYWLVSTGEGNPGIDGGIVRRQGDRPALGAPVNGYVCTTGVESLDATMALAEKNGGTIVVPKMQVPGIGWLAYANDTEGNLFGMLEPTSG